MRVISDKALRDFYNLYPLSKSSLKKWYTLVSKTNFSNFNELRSVFPSADIVKNEKGHTLTIFNIHGNKFRLIALIDYEDKIIHIRHVLTHNEYDKEKWKK
ncbi:MAG: type II toxin-antitoxin system HigB family toxin [Methylococcaceae bacterium]